MSARIYLASSWRNPHQPELVELLRAHGHQVYDFRNPPYSTGFAWSEIGIDAEKCTAHEYRRALLTHPRAAQGFNADFAAMRWADTGLLVLPCGRSAHLELGWMAGAGKRTLILTRDGEEPELMALLADRICISVIEVLHELDPDGVHEPCENCLRPIGQRRFNYDDGVSMCADCAPTLSEAIRAHEEVLSDPAADPYSRFETRDEMARALEEMKQDLAANGDRSLAS